MNNTRRITRNVTIDGYTSDKSPRKRTQYDDPSTNNTQPTKRRSSNYTIIEPRNSIDYIKKYIDSRIDYSYGLNKDPKITSMNDVINEMINEFFGDIPQYSNIYISYLYNPLENMFINLWIVLEDNKLRIVADADDHDNYDDGDNADVADRKEDVADVADRKEDEENNQLVELQVKVRELFGPILVKHKRNIKQIITTPSVVTDDLVKNAFNLLYTELDSLSYIRRVILPEHQVNEYIQFIKLQQDKRGYVSLYLSTIPLFLFILIVDYFKQPLITLALLQSFSRDYNNYIEIKGSGRNIIPTDQGSDLTPLQKLDKLVEMHEMQSYLEILKPDVLRINEIPEVTFEELLDGYRKSIGYNKFDISSVIERSIANPNDMSVTRDIENPDDTALIEEDIASVTTVIDVVPLRNEDNVENIDEGIEIGEEESDTQIGGAHNNFEDFTTVLGHIHDIITEPFTSSYHGLNPKRICDDFIDYSSGNFSGKKIVLDWMGLFMSLVVSLIIKDEVGGENPVDFKAYFLYDNDSVYPQEFEGGDLIMAGYCPNLLYKSDTGLNPITDDISNDIKLYCAGSPDTDDATVIPVTYQELFGEFPPSIKPEDINNGWTSKSYSSLMGLITLALTLENDTTRGSTKEYVTFNTLYPTKIRESAVSKLTKKQKVKLSYETIVAKIDELKEGQHLGDAGKKYVQTFFDLRLEAIALILDHENGGLRVTSGVEDTNYTSLDPSFKLLLYNPELNTFEYEYIYAYVYKKILTGDLLTIKQNRSMSFINNINMVKGIVKQKTNPFKDGGWSDLYKACIITAYNKFTRHLETTSDGSTVPMTEGNLISTSPIIDESDPDYALGTAVKEFNDKHTAIIESFLNSGENIFEIKYNDNTVTRGIQIKDTSMPVDVTEFLETYAVKTGFHNCFTSRGINSGGTVAATNISENYCKIQEEQHITLKRLIYQFFPQDMCHDAIKDRTSLDISKYVRSVADNSFLHIGVDSYDKIISNSRIIEPKNIAKVERRSYEQETASMMLDEQQYTKSVYFGNFTTLDKNNIGLTHEKSLEIRNSSQANTFNNAVFCGEENSGNSATFIDGGTKKVLENIVLPNLCISLNENTVISEVNYTITLYVIVSYTISDGSGDNTSDLIMNVSLYYIKTQIPDDPTEMANNGTHIFVNHQFILGKGISCADIYRDIYSTITKLNSTSTKPRTDIISNEFDPALSVFVLLKKTLCDWLQNFLKIKVHTKQFPRLGFFVKIRDAITIESNVNSSIPTVAAKFVDTPTKINYEGGTITGIKHVLNALNKGVYRNNIYYIYIHSPDPTKQCLYVPYNNTTPLIMFSDYNKPIDIISPNSYVSDSTCVFPRFQLFSYINIFWQHYRPTFSPNNYRYFNTLPSLSQETISFGGNTLEHKPIFCVTGDILDFCFSLILTFITFVPPPEILESGMINLSSFVSDGTNSIIRKNPIPQTEVHNFVILNKNSVVMSGGMKINSNYRRKKKISYSNTKRKSTKKRKSKRVYKQNKMKSKFTKKNIRNNTKKR
jgi:hypothetical protein